MMKHFVIFICCLLLTATAVMGQKAMKVFVEDLGTAVPREAGDNETVVIVRSNMPLEFESTMDKTVDIYNVVQESGFTFYYIKFSTLPKFKGRKLKIKGYGFPTHTEPLTLTAKVPLGLCVLDPGGIGNECHDECLYKGDSLFFESLYDNAKVEYLKALDCPELPEDNPFAQKIEDAGNCADYKRNADNFYNNNKWEDALREYEKVVGLNVKDKYSLGRIEKCRGIIDNLPRTITGKVTDQQNHAPISGVIIKVAIEQKDKKGNVIYGKDGEPKTKFKKLSVTDNYGNYKITVLNKWKELRFLKGEPVFGISEKEKYFYMEKYLITGEQMNVSLTRKPIVLGL